MRTSNVLPLLALVLAVPFTGVQASENPFPQADLEKMVAAGVGEEVLMAWVGSLPDFQRLDTNTIVQLMERKVPQKVIAAAVRKGGQAAAATEVVARYSVPGTGATTRETSRVVDDADYNRARTEYTVNDRTTYVYTQPAVTYASYDTSPYYYSSGYYPASYYGSSYYYPRSSFYIGLGYGYPSYSSYCYPYYRGNYGHYGHYGHHHHGRSYSHYRGGTTHAYHGSFNYRGSRGGSGVRAGFRR